MTDEAALAGRRMKSNLVWHTAGTDVCRKFMRARAETALREGEERLRLFLENVREYALVQLDPELRFTSWNPGAERIFGYTSKEALGQPFSLLLFAGGS